MIDGGEIGGKTVGFCSENHLLLLYIFIVFKSKDKYII
jgi:hypothetical protein